MVTFTSRTYYSPPSIIRWYKDNTLLDIDGSNYNMSMVVTDRHYSQYDITLTAVCDAPENLYGTYKFEAGNRLRMRSETTAINGKRILV